MTPPSTPSKPHRTATEYGVRLHQACQHARAASEDELARLPVDAIVQALVDEHSAEQKESPARPLPAPPDDGSLPVTINFLVGGCTGALRRRSYLSISMRTSGDKPTVLSVHLRFRDQEPGDLSAEAFEQQLSAARAQLREMEAAANIEIESQRTGLAASVRTIIAERSRRTRAFRTAADTLRIPLSPRTDAGTIDLQPRGLTLQQLDQAVNLGTPEWHLADEIAEDIIKTVMSFTVAMERLTATADKLASAGEEIIRDFLLFILNARYQGAATGETFIGQGKSDILVRWRNRDAFLGECKIWKDRKYFDDGVVQLLDRYIIWSNTRAVLILFIRNKKNISQVIANADQYIKENPRLIRAIDPIEPDRRRDYLMRAANDEQRAILMSLLPVVIPRPPLQPRSTRRPGQ
jgi:hypothetical protein